MDIKTAINDAAFVQRFWSKVEKTEEGCWEWKAGRQSTGYGSIEYKGSRFQAHRLAYLLANGHLDPSLFICHSCDNKGCCNPRHLFQGTAKANSEDCWAKGRAAFQQPGFKRWDVGTLRRDLTHCKRGHPFDTANTGKQANGRYCKTCEMERKRRVRAQGR